jgi:hypothetical protein
MVASMTTPRAIPGESTDVVLFRRMLDEIYETLLHPGGGYGRICDLEAKAGYRRVAVGSHEPFSVLSSRWFYDTVITLDDGRKEARLVMLRSKRPGHGYLRQLVERIADAGWKPVIVAPVGPDMPVILRHWGWVCEHRSEGLTCTDVWSAP